MTKILIVGGVAGGATALARLRRLDENAEIILFERGPYVSYANCGLPYYIGDVIKKQDKLLLATKQSFLKQYNAEVRLNSEVTAIDTQSKTLTVYDKENQTAYTESYDKLLLSPGATPLKPPIKGIDLEGVYSLRTVDDAERIKEAVAAKKVKRAVIVGAGFIGMEVMENLAEQGIKPVIVELQDQIMGNFDYEIAAELGKYIREQGIPLFLGQGVQSIAYDDEKRLVVTTTKDKQIYCDMVFLGLGVRPDTALAKSAGLALNDKGAIIVNGHMQTSNPDIYAVGDAVVTTDFVTKTPAQVPLAGPANMQARIAADNILGGSTVYQGAQGTFIVKLFHKVAASTGANEKALKAAGLDYEYSYTHSQSNAGYYPGADMLTIKLLFSKPDGRVLGAQIIGGKGVDKRIDVFATAIRAQMTVFDLINLELAYAPPFGSAKDPVNMAGMVAANILNGDMPILHWNELCKVDWDNTVIIDVREPSELETVGRIKTSVNIPLGQLRHAVKNGEIDKSKTIIITCAVGKRGYLATRILMQNGYKVFNLSGGYTTCKTVHDYIKLNANQPEKW